MALDHLFEPTEATFTRSIVPGKDWDENFRFIDCFENNLSSNMTLTFVKKGANSRILKRVVEEIGERVVVVIGDRVAVASGEKPVEEIGEKVVAAIGGIGGGLKSFSAAITQEHFELPS